MKKLFTLVFVFTILSALFMTPIYAGEDPFGPGTNSEDLPEPEIS
jgi:hypothetical protein